MQTNNDEQQSMVIGGNLAESLTGAYSLNLADVFRQTLTATKKHWLPIFLGFLAFIGILLIGTLIALSVLPEAWVAQIVPTEDGEPVSQRALMILSLIGSVVGAPFWGGLILMGIRHSVDIPTKSINVFDGFSRAAPLVVTLLATSLMTQLIIMLTSQVHWLVGVVAQIYCSVIFAFSLPLVVERGITPLNAIYYSVRLVHYKLPLFILLLLTVTGLVILSSFVLFLPLIIVIPLIFNMVGVVYKEVVGVVINLDDKQQKNDEDSPWTA